MERNDRAGSVSPAEARTALAHAAGVRDHAVQRAASPWWFHPGIACCLLFAFASVSLGREVIPFGVILGLGFGPMAFAAAARHTTGVSVDRFYATPGARRLSLAHGAFVVALIPIGLLLEWVADLRGAMALCGVVVFVATVLLGRRLDAVLRRELRDGA